MQLEQDHSSQVDLVEISCGFGARQISHFVVLSRFNMVHREQFHPAGLLSDWFEEDCVDLHCCSVHVLSYCGFTVLHSPQTHALHEIHTLDDP